MPKWFEIIQVFVTIVLPITLGCMGWLVLSAIESRTVSAVLKSRVDELDSRTNGVRETLTSMQVSLAGNTQDGKRIEDKIDLVGKCILERMEAIANRLSLVERGK